MVKQIVHAGVGQKFPPRWQGSRAWRLDRVHLLGPIQWRSASFKPKRTAPVPAPAPPKLRPRPEPAGRKASPTDVTRLYGDANSQRRFRIYLVGSLAFGAWIAFYIAYVGSSWHKDIRKHAQEIGVLPQDSDVSDRWKQLGRDYDDEVEFSEKCFATNMKRKRKNLVDKAYGKVLEVSAGTGRNFAYYDLEPFDATDGRRNVITSLTVNDQSAVMLGIAEDKFEQEQTRASRPFTGKVDFVVGDAGIRGVIERPTGGYDTIIETMGLCSMVDPVGFLRTMGRLCRQPGEASDSMKYQVEPDDGKGGKILLLEHGRSSWDIVNKMLDSGASMHADHYGCWWNKDIERIVQQSGLEVERIKRYHLGTTWEIHLRPKPDR